MRCKTRQSGYVLLVTLMMLLLMAIATMGLCRISLESAMAAKRASEDLQRRWGLLSCRYTLLEHGPRVLEARWNERIDQSRTEASTPRAPDLRHLRVAEGQVALGKLEFAYVFADEQAKMNVNALLERRNEYEAAATIRTLIGSYSEQLRVEPHPLSKELTALLGSEPLPDFTRVFVDIDLLPFVSDERNQVAVDQLTCWGDGGLRWTHAPEEVVQTLCAPVIGPDRVAKMLELRLTHPHLNVDHLAMALSVNPRQRTVLKNMLTDRSNCYSLRIEVSSPRRRSTQLIIFYPNAIPNERMKLYTF